MSLVTPLPTLSVGQTLGSLSHGPFQHPESQFSDGQTQDSPVKYPSCSRALGAF